MKTLISFDVDMTLLDHATYKIPDSAIEAIEALRKNHFIVLATGRDMDTYYSRQYRDQIQGLLLYVFLIYIGILLLLPL